MLMAVKIVPRTLSPWCLRATNLEQWLQPTWTRRAVGPMQSSRLSSLKTSLWCMEINLSCLYFSLCQDNAFLLIGFCFFQAFIFWYLNTDGQEFARSLKIIDFSTDCGAFSDDSKLQEVTMGLPQRCCIIKSLTVTRWCSDVPQIWMGELERKFHVKAQAGKQTSVISFPEP